VPVLRIGMIVLCLSLVCPVGRAELKDGISVGIQELLEVPRTGDRALPSLALVLQEQTPPPRDPPTYGAEQFDLVSNSVLAGVAPDALTEQFLSCLAVGRELPGLTEYIRAFGLRRNRETFIGQIWDAAKRLSGKDPQTAQRYARTAIVTLALERSVSCTAALFRIERDPAFDLVLGLSRSESDRLRSLIDSLKPPRRFSDSVLEWTANFDRLVEPGAPGPLDRADLNAVLAGIEERWNLIPQRPDLRFTVVCSDLWQIACLAGSHGDREAMDRIVALSQKLASGTESAHERRWLREAVETPGARLWRKAPGATKPALRDFKPRNP
jgi:hypothetical protein